jgi:HAD superfamily hydrolase (TIGR01509 family)
MKPLMDRFELWPFFDLVITAADVKNPKPHPESIEKILAKLNLKKKEAVFIGDSEVDRQAAESAGVKFIAYKNRSIAKESFIDDHLKILNFIEDGQIFE